MFRPWRHVALHRRVLVNLKTDKAIRGVLFDQRGPLLVLKDAFLMEAGRDPVQLVGDVVIEANNVDFCQVVGSSENG